jgi:hypothetical protein
MIFFFKTKRTFSKLILIFGQVDKIVVVKFDLYFLGPMRGYFCVIGQINDVVDDFDAHFLGPSSGDLCIVCQVNEVVDHIDLAFLLSGWLHLIHIILYLDPDFFSLRILSRRLRPIVQVNTAAVPPFLR